MILVIDGKQHHQHSRERAWILKENLIKEKDGSKTANMYCSKCFRVFAVKKV